MFTKNQLETGKEIPCLLAYTSFGLEFTLAAPFLWLAYFSEVTTPEGRERLRRAGLDPDLLRVSVGLEPIEEIWAAFEVALKK